MGSSGTPTKPIPADLYPPAQPVPTPAPSGAQRRAEAQVAHAAANPPLKGNRHNGNGSGWYR